MAQVQDLKGKANSIVLKPKFADFIGWSPKVYKDHGFTIESMTFRAQGPAKGRKTEVVKADNLTANVSGGYYYDFPVNSRFYEEIRHGVIEGYWAIMYVRGPLYKSKPKWTFSMKRVYLTHIATGKEVILQVVTRNAPKAKFNQQLQAWSINGKRCDTKDVSWLMEVFANMLHGTCKYEPSIQIPNAVCNSMDRDA